MFARNRRLSPEDTRTVQETASLVSAQIELSELEAQGERLARAELRALRAQISPHFIYNALAAVAAHIHSSPEEARELLSDFAEFTRYAFRGEHPYVTLADELHYVERYLRLERARFGEQLEVRIEVAPEVLQVVVPVLSLQPLVENAVRHGVERRGHGRIAIIGRDAGTDVLLRVRDDGVGMSGRARSAGPRRQRRRHRALERPGPAAGELRPRLRARDRRSRRRRHDRHDDPAQVPCRGPRRMSSGRALSVLAVDDERPALADLARLLRGLAQVEEVTCAHSGSEALRQLAERQFDALFLDVRMPDLNGLELAGVLDRFANPPAVVFVSAYGDGAVRAFEVHALDYLMKPVSRKRIEEAIMRVAEASAARQRRPLAGDGATRSSRLRTPGRGAFVAVERGLGQGTRIVSLAAILYVQARGDYVRLVTDEGRFLQRDTLAEVERRWTSHGFHRVHRAYLVNLRRAVEVRPDHGGTASIVLADGSALPVARRQVADLRRRLRM